MNSGCKSNSQRHMELLRHIVCHKPPFCPLLGAGMKSLPAGGLRAFPSGQRSYPKGALRTAESKATIEDAEQNPCPPEASGRSFAGRETIPKELCERQGASRRLRARSNVPARRRPSGRSLAGKESPEKKRNGRLNDTISSQRLRARSNVPARRGLSVVPRRSYCFEAAGGFDQLEKLDLLAGSGVDIGEIGMTVIEPLEFEAEALLAAQGDEAELGGFDL